MSGDMYRDVSHDVRLMSLYIRPGVYNSAAAAAVAAAVLTAAIW